MIIPLVFLSTWIAVAEPQQPSPDPGVDSFQPQAGWKSLGRSLWFDPERKTLVIRARIALTDGPLEHLLCLKGTKEHESILATDAAPRQIHAGLLLTGAEPGHPVRFRPRFQPPTGTPIAIEVEWNEGGKIRRADARGWVRDDRLQKPLETDWVFAGSELFEDPRTKTMIYAAEDGDLITVANFPSSILDLPFASDSSDAERVYSADPSKVPPRGTPVTIYLKPRAASTAPKTKGL